mmetsp:Transcript_93500/g.261521  ORF Transcript_93500/g.261521 Transcript_93500/m.261521 type:complete len:276 (-) Transcript_93500:330-1157(-)
MEHDWPQSVAPRQLVLRMAVPLRAVLAKQKAVEHGLRDCDVHHDAARVEADLGDSGDHGVPGPADGGPQAGADLLALSPRQLHPRGHGSAGPATAGVVAGAIERPPPPGQPTRERVPPMPGIHEVPLHRRHDGLHEAPGSRSPPREVLAAGTVLHLATSSADEGQQGRGVRPLLRDVRRYGEALLRHRRRPRALLVDEAVAAAAEVLPEEEPAPSLAAACDAQLVLERCLLRLQPLLAEHVQQTAEVGGVIGRSGGQAPEQERQVVEHDRHAVAI